MILFTYLFKRFFAYTLGINFLLTILTTFIEFFEKLAHVNNASINDIVRFLTINFIPSFFDQLAISSWLATMLIIKELLQQHEWDTLKLLRISYKKIFSFLALAGCLLMTSSFILKEKLVVPLTFRAEHFKLKNFKQIAIEKVVNKWLLLDKTTFCYFNILDLAKQEGNDLCIIYMSPQFSIEKTFNCSHFFVDLKKQEITVPEGTFFTTNTNTQQKITHYHFNFPTFFSQTTMHTEIPSLFYLIKNVIFNKNILPPVVYQEILAKIFKRILNDLQLIIYPLITFGLFCIFEQMTIFRWISIMLPYPFLTVTNLITENLLSHGAPAWILFIPYILIIGFISILFTLF